MVTCVPSHFEDVNASGNEVLLARSVACKGWEFRSSLVDDRSQPEVGSNRLFRSICYFCPRSFFPALVGRVRFFHRCSSLVGSYCCYGGRSHRDASAGVDRERPATVIAIERDVAVLQHRSQRGQQNCTEYGGVRRVA
jgi:hypothetical protein